MNHRWLPIVVAFVVLLTAGTAATEEPADALHGEFLQPPSSAWPRTWWHWTRGAVTTEGITKDLEWMQRVGIAGFQLADVNAGGGQTVQPTVDFGSPEWLEAVRHAASEAKRLGLEMTVFSSPGWSITGGPWVEPQQAMKKVVWSELGIEGPQAFDDVLPAPSTNTGPFQDWGARPGRSDGFYRDIRVLAFRTPTAEQSDTLTPAEITTSDGSKPGAALTDHNYNSAVRVAPAEEGTEAWIEQRFDQPVTVRAVTLAGPRGIPVGRVTASDDGKTYRALVELPGSQLYRQGRVRTFSLPTTTARWFRLELTAAPLGPAETMSEARPQPAEAYALVEWQLHQGARVHRWEEKAGFSHLFEYESVPTPEVDADATIDPQQVIDLTAQLNDDGRLAWQVPDGHWTIVRLGYTLTGARNRPATPAGSGLEVDKLSAKHVGDYYDAYAGMLKQSLGDLYGDALRCWLIDSWEAGTQNWTEDMIAEFTRRRGYDPTPYLPVLAGHVIDDNQASDRFLWDFRRTIADMIADNHYGVLSKRLHDDGLQVYSEASGVSLEIPEDTLLNKSKVDVPMGEFWVRDLHPRLMYLQDVRGAASAARAYGKSIVAAEAFTGGGYEPPFNLKRVSDYWFAQGINRLVYHTSAHQPLDTPPGNTMVGTHLHRNITWAEQARPLNLYFARICHLLQHGKAAVDVAYLLNEGAPSTPTIWGSGTQPELPEGYRHDFINADVLLNRMTVDDGGRFTLPDGMSYRLLVLPESRHMRPELLEKLCDLVAAGATIFGPRPLGSPSLADQPQADQRVRQLADELWGDTNGTTRTIHYHGKGQVIWGRTLADALARIELPPDFQWSGPLDAELAWMHRRSGDIDLYYVSNLTDQPARIEARFRVAGRGVEIWRPDDGSRTPIAGRPHDSATHITLHLQPHETVFVVFAGEATNSNDVEPRAPRESLLTTIDGPWTVAFPEGSGAPAQIEVDALASWTKHELPGVQYFSGTATYSTTFEASPDAGGQIMLDLGDVRDLATVTLNGNSLPVLWKPPYRIDITDALRAGTNRLAVEITNQWTNRIVGDQRVAENERVLPVDASPSRFGVPRQLAESGLLGPVRVLEIVPPSPTP